MMNGNSSQFWTTIMFCAVCTSSARRDRQEEHVADELNRDVHKANRHVPEQDGQRCDAEMHAERLRVGKEEKSNQERRDGNEASDRKFLKEPEHQQHESSDSLKEIPDGGRHDLSDVRERIRRLVLDARAKQLDELRIAGVRELHCEAP